MRKTHHGSEKKFGHSSESKIDQHMKYESWRRLEKQRIEQENLKMYHRIEVVRSRPHRPLETSQSQPVMFHHSTVRKVKLPPVLKDRVKGYVREMDDEIKQRQVEILSHVCHDLYRKKQHMFERKIVRFRKKSAQNDSQKIGNTEHQMKEEASEEKTSLNLPSIFPQENGLYNNKDLGGEKTEEKHVRFNEETKGSKNIVDKIDQSGEANREKTNVVSEKLKKEGTEKPEKKITIEEKKPVILKGSLFDEDEDGFLNTKKEKEPDLVAPGDNSSKEKNSKDNKKKHDDDLDDFFNSDGGNSTKKKDKHQGREAVSKEKNAKTKEDELDDIFGDDNDVIKNSNNKGISDKSSSQKQGDNKIPDNKSAKKPVESQDLKSNNSMDEAFGDDIFSNNIDDKKANNKPTVKPEKNVIPNKDDKKKKIDDDLDAFFNDDAIDDKKKYNKNELRNNIDDKKANNKPTVKPEKNVIPNKADKQDVLDDFFNDDVPTEKKVDHKQKNSNEKDGGNDKKVVQTSKKQEELSISQTSNQKNSSTRSVLTKVVKVRI